ncbi:MAG: sporulation protein YqfD [Defluviitaleaceae bacterium]|nr:sporulation protein YqfD [Defluviitaleaceae bacterium]MCL2836838.1 sporulation protein YqfD [Defluviitaleaceae bacterium]
MFLRLYNFLRGYVTVAVSGFAVARFINLAAHKNIYLWNVREKDGRTFLCVSVKGFRLMRQPAKKSGCKLKIVKKTGLPFILYRYRKRKVLALGLLLFIGLMVYLTSFLWLVTVSGNNLLETPALLGKLRELGVAAGLTKSGLNVREIEEELMAGFPNIAFANLRVKGTRAQLSIVETIQRKDFVDKSAPCDVVAAKDGLIHEIATDAGRPLVRPGDVVQAGDVLVSGELKAGADDTGYQSYFVHASSKVTAKLFYEYVFDVPLTYIIKSFTGNVKRNYGIILFNQKIYLEKSPSPFTNYDVKAEENRFNFGPDYPLPAAYFTDTFREFIPVTAHRTVEEAEIMGQTIVASRLLRELPPGSEVVSTEMSYERKDDVLVVSAVVAVLEVISEQRPLKTVNNEQLTINN